MIKTREIQRRAFVGFVGTERCHTASGTSELTAAGPQVRHTWCRALDPPASFVPGMLPAGVDKSIALLQKGELHRQPKYVSKEDKPRG